jgi:hypothetical protein
MERFFSRATRLLLLVAVVLFFGLTVGLQLVSGLVPERWQFDNLPRWIQIPAVIVAMLYLVAEIWCLFHQSARPKQSQSHSADNSEGHTSG